MEKWKRKQLAGFRSHVSIRWLATFQEISPISFRVDIYAGCGFQIDVLTGFDSSNEWLVHCQVKVLLLIGFLSCVAADDALSESMLHRSEKILFLQQAILSWCFLMMMMMTTMMRMMMMMMMMMMMIYINVLPWRSKIPVPNGCWSPLFHSNIFKLHSCLMWFWTKSIRDASQLLCVEFDCNFTPLSIGNSLLHYTFIFFIFFFSVYGMLGMCITMVLTCKKTLAVHRLTAEAAVKQLDIQR